jgi:hypothetical protein
MELGTNNVRSIAINLDSEVDAVQNPSNRLDKLTRINLFIFKFKTTLNLYKKISEF